jgi:DNA polymerase III delta prime subunit
MAVKEQWADKYSPQTLDEYVFSDNKQKQIIQRWVNNGSFPHILLSGGAGVGKTTLARILFNTFKIHPFDIKEINASRDNSVDVVREKIVGFFETIPQGDFKVVFLDEADYLSLNAQAALRGVIDEYQEFARFIFTCNYPNRIIPALHSRCQGRFHIEKSDINEFTARAATILISENIKFDLDTLDTYVKATYPDLRKCINEIELNSMSGTLIIDNTSEGSADYKIEMVQLFKAGRINEARKLICKQARPEEIEDIYRWLYDNIELFGDDGLQDKAILIIKDGLVNHTIIADPEINLSATLIRLANI